jgi:DNA-binding GntR family transcriptional regulator
VIRWFQENTAFHDALAQACGNRRLARAVREVMDESLRIYFISTHPEFNTATAVTNHKRLVKALRSRDLDRAIELLGWEADVGIQMTIDGLATQESRNDRDSRA